MHLTTLLLAGLATIGVQAASVVDLIPDNFDSIVLKSGKPALVEFFAPWCGHCKSLAPTYEELAQTLESSKDKVTIAKVDADEHKSLGQRFGIQGFPTIKWFDGKSDKPEDYNGGRDLESLSAFVAEKTGAKPKAKKSAPSNVEILNDSTFPQKVGGDKDVLVAFTAPWCGHCKTLAPTWETLANDFAHEPSVLIAKVDAEAPNAKATAQEQGVKSYPTIKYFPKGSTTAIPYEGGRSEKDLIDFLNKNAGTHRTVGGGLGVTAGTIEALDTLVSKFVSGDSSLVSLTEQAKEAAAGLKDTSADYYLRVISKLASGPNYVQKELTRLQGLLKKGGLSPEKMEELIKRSNVLQKFTGIGEEKGEL